MRKKRVFSVAGFSGTGKTKLISNLIGYIQDKGYSVGVIKSTSRDILQPEETDTGIFLDSGSEFTVLLGPSSTTIAYSKRVDIREVLGGYEINFIIVEGAKKSKIPKFWCVGSCDGEIQKMPENVKAIVYWKEFEQACLDAFEDTGIPMYASENISALADIIFGEAVPMDNTEL